MSRVYEGTLHGDRVEWDEPPPATPRPIRVQATLLEDVGQSSADRRKAMADALREIPEMGGIASIPDPVAWQREMREERPLPCRDDDDAAR